MWDFYIILDSQGATSREKIDRNAIKEFTDWIKDLDMVIILCRGFKYTWSNNRDYDKYAKIDHMFCNEHWKSQSLHFQLDCEALITSDHFLESIPT